MTKKICLGILLCLILSSPIFAQNTLEKRVQNFVAEIYGHYANENFTKVYQGMHPNIQAILTEDDYLNFQRHHFQRLRLKLSEIKVGEVKSEPILSKALQVFLKNEEGYKLYGASLNYRAHFTSGVRLNQVVTKTAYVVVYNSDTPGESFYLLWDPASLEEEIE